MKNRFLLSLFLLLFISVPIVQAQSTEGEYKKLIGEWVRIDGGYVLVINDIDEEGNIDAAYLNPRSINVSEARVGAKSDEINIFVELQDRGYPGSYYTLIYDSETDRLVGVYHHLGLNQDFEVFFVRE